MAFLNKKQEGQNAEYKIEERVIKEWFPEKEVLKRKELTEKEKQEREMLKQEIENEKTELLLKSQSQAIRQSEKIKMQDSTQGQIKYLLVLAQTKGLYFAIQTAKQTKNPYLIDLFHDILAKQGLYKKFKR